MGTRSRGQVQFPSAVLSLRWAAAASTITATMAAHRPAFQLLPEIALGGFELLVACLLEITWSSESAGLSGANVGSQLKSRSAHKDGIYVEMLWDGPCHQAAEGCELDGRLCDLLAADGARAFGALLVGQVGHQSLGRGRDGAGAREPQREIQQAVHSVHRHCRQLPDTLSYWAATPPPVPSVAWLQPNSSQDVPKFPAHSCGCSASPSGLGPRRCPDHFPSAGRWCTCSARSPAHGGGTCTPVCINVRKTRA